MTKDAPGSTLVKQLAAAVIRDEHLGLATALHRLQRYIEPVLERELAPNYDLFATIFSYIDTFMDRVHHPKEDEYLFKVLRLRTHRADDLLIDLQHEHAISPAMSRELQDALRATRGGSLAEVKNFADLLRKYTAMQEAHMRKEAQLLMPIAYDVLTESDWMEVYEAFRENRDPLFGPGAPATPD